jgi:predicted TIM-barrel fold metal-dependent hydrolase
MADLIDVHTHFFSRPFFDALAASSPLPGNPRERLERVAAKAGLDLPPDDLGRHLARWIGEFNRNGVRRAVAFASLPEEVPAVAEAAAKSNGRLVPCGLVNPTVAGAADRARAMLAKQGYRGVLLFPALHRYRASGPEAAEVFRVVDEHGGFAVVHCGIFQVKLRDLLGIPRPVDPAYSNPLDLVPAANAFRRTTFVIPHFGAGPLRETLMVGAQCENVVVDSSSSNSWTAVQERPMTLADVFSRALGVFGPERILFGTDSSTFPRGWRADLLDAQRKALAELSLPKAQQDLVFGGNAERILGL